MTKKIVRGLRLEPVLNAQANAVAEEKQLSFSEWIRNLIREAVTHHHARKRRRA